MIDYEQKLIITEKLLDDNSVNESIIIAYLDIAGREILNRAHPFDDTKTEVPDKYAFLQCEIAVYLINKRGAEGQLGHTENGIDRKYETGHIPKSLISQIIPYAGVPR